MSSKLNLAGNYLSLPVNELGNEYRLNKKLSFYLTQSSYNELGNEYRLNKKQSFI